MKLSRADWEIWAPGNEGSGSKSDELIIFSDCSDNQNENGNIVTNIIIGLNKKRCDSSDCNT